MKPKKPRPRKPRERLTCAVWRSAAADFYRLPELELARRQSADRRLPQGAGLTAAAHRVWTWGDTLVTLYGADLADRILRGQKIDCGGAVRAH